MAATELPNPEELQAFVARSGEGPVTMLNLLRFHPDKGAERYRAYAQAVAPLLASRGASATYIGRGAELLIGSEADHWDLVVLVEYPTRSALLDMIGSAEYREIQHLRSEAVTRSVLLATDPRDAP